MKKRYEASTLSVLSRVSFISALGLILGALFGWVSHKRFYPEETVNIWPWLVLTIIVVSIGAVCSIVDSRNKRREHRRRVSDGIHW